MILVGGRSAAPINDPDCFSETPLLFRTQGSLGIDEPTAARQIDTSRIALMSGQFQVEYYADVEKTDSAPAMVQLLLVQSFQNTGRLPVVAPSRRSNPTK